MKSESLDKTVDTIASECIAVRMRMLNRVVTKMFDDALRPLGIKVSQLNILMVVAKRGPVSPAEVGRVLHLEKSTLSRNSERIMKRGWIEVLDDTNARNHLLQLTPKGSRLIEKARPLWSKAQKKTRKVLGETVAKAIQRAANRVWSADQAA